MTLPYLVRLLSLSLACFFLVHTVLAMAVWAVSRRAIQRAERLRPKDGATLLLALRLLPAAAALAAVALLCVPSFLWLEPSETAEEAGLACLAAALLVGAVWLAAVARAAQGLVQSCRYRRTWKSVGQPAFVMEGWAVWVVDAAAPVLALAGVVRPRILLSRGLMEALDPDQLRVALLHEQAHCRSRDNLKRLALLLAPQILPGWRAFHALERAWARITEWAADESAAGGDEQRRLALAEALVRAVRLGCAGIPAGPLAAALLEGPGDLDARVQRLLEAPPERKSGRRYWRAAVGLAAAALAVLLLQPGTLYSVHWLLEGLMR